MGKGRKGKGSDKGSEPTSGQEPFPVQYGCGHFDAKPLKHTVDVLVKTVKFVLVQRNIEEGLIKGRIEFMCVPYVDGSITVEFYEMVLESPGSSPTKKVLLKPSPALEAKRNMGKHITGVDISFIHKMCLKEQYKVEIKTKADEDTGGIKVHELTLAVFEKVEDDIQIKVTDQIVWVNERRFSCLDSSGIFKALDIDNKKSAPECGTCLESKNPGVLTPVGNISVTTEKIGSGSRTTVFNGTFQDQHCAVKRYPIKHKDVVRNDIKMMKDIGSRSNIVSYIGTEKTDQFVLVAVEKCETSLDKLIASRVLEINEYKLTLEGFKDLVLWTCKNDPTKLYPTEHLLTFLRGIVFGLDFLHSRKISHNNLKIQNVLINRDTTDIIPKLSNFSLSCKLGTTDVGSSGGLDHVNEEPTFPDDLYDLGNLILNCITITRDGEALSKKVKKINWVKHLPEAHDLITQLQNRDPKLRPTAAQAKNHPFLWGHKERLSFLYYASECLKKDDQESKIQEVYENMYYNGLDGIVDKELRKEIVGVQANLNEKNRTTSTASDCEERENRRSKIYKALLDNVDYNYWDNKVGEELVKQIEARQVFLNKKNYTNFTPSYHGVSLLQAIRNHYIHLPSLPKKLRIELGESFIQLDDYFSSRFPKLLMQVYNLFKGNPVNGKTLIDEYFELWEIKVINASLNLDDGKHGLKRCNEEASASGEWEEKSHWEEKTL